MTTFYLLGAASAVLLTIGFYRAGRRRREAEQRLMEAFRASAAFDDNESAAPRCVRCGEGVYVRNSDRVVCSHCGASA